MTPLAIGYVLLMFGITTAILAVGLCFYLDEVDGGESGHRPDATTDDDDEEDHLS